MNKSGGKVDLIVEESTYGAAINAYELANFLYLFRTVYVLAIEKNDSYHLNAKAVAEAVRSHQGRWYGPALASKARKILPEDIDLEFSGISKSSPLRFSIYASSTMLIALSAAVILSGGEVNLTEGKFTLPPLAHGIRELREALGQTPPPKLPSENKLQPPVTKKTRVKRKDG